MAHVIVRADTGHEGEGEVLMSERVNPVDFETDHAANALIERVGWAVLDADEVERDKRSAAAANN